MDGLTVRFAEFQYYDIMRDAEVVKLEAISSIGTWSAELVVTTASKLREGREKFRQEVIALMQEGALPGEVALQ